MTLFGLTGNIGCGKSTVASLLAVFPDVVLFNCDKIGKELLTDPGSRGDISGILGANVFLPSGEADFRQIAEIIFSDEAKKKRLEALIHPLVWDKVTKEMATAKEGTIGIAESAIIFEIGWENRFAGVIVAACNKAQQLHRLKDIRGMSLDAIRARVAQQLPSEEKKRRAEFVIDTDCTLSQLGVRVEGLYHKLKHAAAKKKGVVR